MADLPNKPRYTVTEVAFGFSVSRRTVYLWIATGKLPVVRTPGGALRIPREALADPSQPKESEPVM